MLARSTAEKRISALRAAIFSAVVGVALTFIFVLDVHLQGDHVAAAVLAALLGALALGGYLYLFQPKEAASLARLVLLALLVVLWVAAAKLLLAPVLPDNDRLFLAYLLPVAAAPMLVAALLDGGLAVVVAVVLAFLVTFAGFYQPDARSVVASNATGAFQMVSVFTLAGLVGIYGVHRAERVNRYLLAGGAVALVSFVGLLVFWLLDPRGEVIDLAWALLATTLGGLLSAVITVGAFIVLGLLFGITTRVQLMELAQLDHPLLRRLQAEAPGTFHHSVVVSNLAERAADLVGADSLLVRAGCYYHDIGKLARPSFYIENQLEGRNPHERLDPYTSARIISAHVAAGMEMARKHRLPAQVRAFISEHHGTRLVTYFYRKASQEKADVDARQFAYAGPKPRSRETAIVMLADSAESVVRSSRDRSPERIDALVDAVISERLAEGQLDECDLTLRDLKVIGEALKTTLRGIYHRRIEYPPPTEEEREALAARFLEQVPSSPIDGSSPPMEIERPG